MFENLVAMLAPLIGAPLPALLLGALVLQVRALNAIVEALTQRQTALEQDTRQQFAVVDDRLDDLEAKAHSH